MRLRRIAAADEVIEKSSYVVHEPGKQRGHWQELFDCRQPLQLEIGMGKGRFIIDMARLHPRINYIGIERYTSVLYRALQKMEVLRQEGQMPTNLRFLCIDAWDLPDIFAPEEVERIYLNFSDPWPKARHANRRLTSEPFLCRYDKVLMSDGKIEFKTDNRELFDFSLETAAASAVFQIEEKTYDLHRDEKMCQGNVMTEYEEKFSSRGNPICKMVLRRQPADTSYTASSRGDLLREQ